MSQVSRQAVHLLVVVEPGLSPVETVEYAVREARDTHAESRASVGLDVFITHPEGRPPDSELLTRISDAVGDLETTGECRTESVRVAGDGATTRTAALLDRLGDEEYARVILGGASTHDVEQFRERFGVAAVQLAST